MEDYQHSALWITGGIVVFIAAVRFCEAYLSRINLPKSVGSGTGLFLLILLIATGGIYFAAESSTVSQLDPHRPIVKPFIEFSAEELTTWNDDELQRLARERSQANSDSTDFLSIIREIQSRSPNSASTVIKLLDENPNPIIIQSIASEGSQAKEALPTLEKILNDFDANCWEPNRTINDPYIKRICAGGKTYRATVVDSYSSIAQAVSEEEIGNSSAGTDQLNTALIDAILSGDIETVKQTLSKGASPNAIVIPVSEVDAVVAQPTTPLRAAIQINSQQIIELLLAVGGDLNKRPWPALCEAIRYSNEPLTHYLLEHGANPELFDGDGTQPLRLATEKDNVNIVSDLLDRKANPRIFDVSKRNAFLVAKSGSNPRLFAMIKAVLPDDYSAVDPSTKSGTTPQPAKLPDPTSNAAPPSTSPSAQAPDATPH